MSHSISRADLLDVEFWLWVVAATFRFLRDYSLGLLYTYTGRVAEHRGVLLDVRDASIPMRMRGKIVRGRFENDEADLVERYLPRDIAVIELGGGIGFVSCLSNELIGADCTHVVVEGNPELIDTLKRNRRLNSCDFTIENRVYAPDEEQVEFELPPKFTKGSVHRTYERGSSVPATTVESITDQLDVDEFSLVVDIEGSEVELVESELPFLERHCRTLLVEFHDSKEDIDVPEVAFERTRSSLESSHFRPLDEDGQVWTNEKME